MTKRWLYLVFRLAAVDAWNCAHSVMSNYGEVDDDNDRLMTKMRTVDLIVTATMNIEYGCTNRLIKQF